jgi:hypothetical protein
MDIGEERYSTCQSVWTTLSSPSSQAMGLSVVD